MSSNHESAFSSSFANFQKSTGIAANSSKSSYFPVVSFATATNPFSSKQSRSQESLESQETLLGSLQRGAESAYTSVSQAGASLTGPRNPDADCFGLSTFQRYTGFAIMIITSFFFFMISFFTLPMVLISPGKFAMTYTMGSLLFLGSFTLLNGWKAHAKHLFCWERAPFTGTYLGSMIGCLYFAVISPNYLAILLFTIFQIIALCWYMGSYLPGGTNGLRFFARSATGLPV